MKLNPTIFKAYDVRGTYPEEINEDAARAIGVGFIAYLKAKQVAVGRDMRLSSPSLAAAFIDGVTSQGADVVDYGMMPTDMLYYAVAADGLEGGVQITASHNPKQYNGMKMVRREAFPLSGEEGISDIREMIGADAIPAAAAHQGHVTTKNVLDPYVEGRWPDTLWPLGMLLIAWASRMPARMAAASAARPATTGRVDEARSRAAAAMAASRGTA